ncbi:MAG: ABC transporter substrate-binding protein [Erysipelotrichaceae bacterium]
MKKLMRGVLATTALVSLVGCTTGNANDKTGEPIDLTIWHTFTEHHEATLQEIVADFNASQENITVTALTQPLDGFSAKVYEAVSNKTGPDIVFLDSSSASDYVDAGFSVDFSKYMDINEYQSRVNPGLFAESTGYSDGKLHSLSLQSTGPILFYNKTMYDDLGLEAPMTWEQLTENSKVIYKELGIPGFAVDSKSDFALMLLEQYGTDYLDLDGKKVNLDTEETVTWLNWFAEGVQEGYFQVAPTTGAYNSGDLSGKVLASYIGSSAGLAYNDLGDDELATSIVPLVADTTTPWVQTWTRNIIGFTSDEATEQAITDFALFFTNTENSAKWSIAFGGLSPYSDVEALDEYQAYVDGNIALQALMAQSSYAGALPAYAGASTVRTELDKMISSVATGLMSAEDAITSAEATSSAALQ